MIALAEQRIERILSDVIAVEGGYVNDAADRGGETRWGITATTARAHGYTGPMMALPEATARAIYRTQYVDAPRFGDVVAIDPDLGAKLVDIGVNMGPAVAAAFLQRWLNAFNDTGTRYAELVVDGQIGTQTLDALRAGNPAARVLPLLDALAARCSTRVVLDYLDDTRVQVDVAISESCAERAR